MSDTCAGGKHAFLVDHNIDGRVLMPATSYVCTAWEAAAVAAGTDMRSFPVEFRDVQIHQAVVVTGGQKITLGVQITPDHHFFVSLPAATAKHEAMACTGDTVQLAVQSSRSVNSRAVAGKWLTPSEPLDIQPKSYTDTLITMHAGAACWRHHLRGFREAPQGNGASRRQQGGRRAQGSWRSVCRGHRSGVGAHRDRNSRQHALLQRCQPHGAVLRPPVPHGAEAERCCRHRGAAEVTAPASQDASAF